MPRTREHASPVVRLVNPDRPAAELVCRSRRGRRPDCTARQPDRCSMSSSCSVVVPRERMMDCTSNDLSSTSSNSGKSRYPEELERGLVDQPELAAEVQRGAARARVRPAAARRREEHGRARIGAECLELPFGEELRDRRANLAVCVARRGTRAPSRPTPSRTPRASASSARENALRHGEEPHRWAFANTPNSDPRVISVASWISSPKRRSGLSEPYRSIASSYVIRGNGEAGGSTLDALSPDLARPSPPSTSRMYSRVRETPSRRRAA